MERDGRRYLVIDYGGYCHPQDLHQANNFEFGASPLGGNHHRLQGTRLREFSSHEGRLYDGDDLLPVSWVGVFLPRFCRKPHPEGFVPYYRQASGTMQLQLQY